MIIAHELIGTLGERRSGLLLALLNPDGNDPELAAADIEAFAAFLTALERHYGPEGAAFRQLVSLKTLQVSEPA